jgi:FixJ family two-component response regulator
MIAVIDDEAVVREAAENLLRSAGFNAECFASAEDFLSAPGFAATACLVLDITLPGMNGLQLQQKLLRLGVRMPIVFVTACEDAGGRMRAEALRAGALAVLRKPYLELEFLSAVQDAIGG